MIRPDELIVDNFTGGMKTVKKPLSMSVPPIRVRFTGSADKERTVRWLRELIEKARAAKAGVQSAA